MKKIVFLIMAFCLCIFMNAFSRQKFVIYQDRKNKYLLKYPNSWEKKQKHSKQIFFLSPKEDEEDDFRENVNVLIKNLNLKSLPSQYGRLVVRQLRRRFENFQLDFYKPITLLKVKGFHFIYSAEFNNQVYKWSQVFFLKDRKLYIFTYTSKIRDFERYYPIFLRMIYSFRLGVFAQI